MRVTEEEYTQLVRNSRVSTPPRPPPEPKTPTDHARLLWRQIIAAGLPGPWYPEHTFHESRNWQIDCAAPESKIGVEVDGGVHRIKGKFLRDMEKHNALTFAGWVYLRVTPEQVQTGEALALVRAYVAAKR